MSSPAPEANNISREPEAVPKLPRSSDALAWFVDLRFSAIAKNVPRQVMTSPQGTQVMHELYRLDGVGTLYASYLGYLVGQRQLGLAYDAKNPQDAYAGIRIAIRSGDAVIHNKFALDWWKNPHKIELTSVDHIRSIQENFPEPGLAQIVDSLHRAYMDLGDASASITDLQAYAQKRVEQ